MAVAYTLAPNIFQQWFDDDGNPADGYKIFTYQSGTSTKLATYTDAAGTVAQTNPIVLNSAGRPPSPIYFQPLAYKVVLALPEDTDPPASPLKTVDPASAVPSLNSELDIPGVSGESLTAGDLIYLSAGDGGLTAGRWYKADADVSYASIRARVLGFNTVTASAGLAITVRMGGRMSGLSGLTAGQLYYASATAGAITATPPQNPRKIGQADSTTTLVIRVDLPAEPYRLLYSARTALATVGATETTLATYTLAANLCSQDDLVRYRFWGQAAANANAKTLKVYFGGSVIITVLAASVALNNRFFTIDGDVLIVNTAQARLNGRFTADTATVATFSTSAQGAVTLTGTIDIKVTGQGVTTGDLTDFGFVVEKMTSLIP